MKTLTLVLLPALAVPGLVSAQDEATTLARLVDRSDHVATVRPLSIGTVEAELRSIRFVVTRTLKGAPGSEITLAEPAMHGCGRALYGVIPGVVYLAFLVDREAGVRLTASSARALLTVEPGLVPHVAALIATPSGAPRTNTLSRAFDSSSPRVRVDAALALAIAPGLDQVDTTGRGACVNALSRALNGASQELLPLLTVARRMHLSEAVPDLVTAALDTPRGDWRKLFASSAAEADPEVASAFLAANLPRDAAGRDRAMVVLSHLEVAGSEPALRALLASEHRRHVVFATTMLMRLGSSTKDLEPAVPPDVLLEAERAKAAPGRPSFRNLRPERAR